MTPRSRRWAAKPQSESPESEPNPNPNPNPSPSPSSLHGAVIYLPAPRGRTPSLTAPSTISLPPRSREEKGTTQHWRHFTDDNTEARRGKGTCLGSSQQAEFILGTQSSTEALCCLLKGHLALEMDFLT